ncbi:hypothetical protein [Devosia sp. 63-57]|uniref:hypothetical protein n=1 Tax=Devosia sp. 63-57 TaxID=1895751 RepID=UPI00257E45A9|nr:hypothetical protein [Devosia sp. 63-57]
MIYQTDLLTLNDAINAARQSFDAAGRRGKLPPDIVEAEYLKFEQVRFRFANFYMEARRYGRYEQANSLLRQLQLGIKGLLNDEDFKRVAHELYVSRPIRLRNEPHHVELGPLLDLRPTSSVYDLLDRILYAVRDGVEQSFEVERLVSDNSSIMKDSSRLRSIVPEQKISPVQFEIEDGKLAVKPQNSSPIPGREEIASVARDDIIRRGASLIGELKNSNCDPRLLRNMEELQGRLCSGDSPILIGISNNACDHLAKVFSSELPDATSALLLAHVSSVSMYLAQFSDWRAFSNASETLDFSSVDIAALSQTLGHVVSSFTKEPDLADPEVPKTLLEVQKFIADPQKASKNAALAAARTLENLVIRVFGYGADYIDQTVKKSISDLSTTTSKIIVISLLSAALVAANNLSILEGTVGGLNWMSDAAQIVTRQIDLLRTGSH